jgi:hypothetical protein
MGLLSKTLQAFGPRPADSVTRTAIAMMLRHVDKTRSIDAVVRESWPADKHVALVLRAATAPADTTTVMPTVVAADFIDALAGQSSGMAVLSRGVALDATLGHTFTIPNFNPSASGADFIAELSPIPVEQAPSTVLILTLKKIAAISPFTREALTHTIPNLEIITRASLFGSVATVLDSRLFDATAGDTTRPAGIRNGIGAAAAASADADANVNMFADLSAVIGAVAAVAGNNPILIVCGPAQSRRLKMRMAGRDPGFEVFASSGVAEGLVIGIASNALASAIDPNPKIEVSDQTVLNFDDASPVNITTGGVAATTKSLWQTDSLAVKIRLRVDWGLRSSSGCAWITGTTW